MAIAVAESGGRIVGQYPDMTVLFRYLDQRVLCFSPVDNFIVQHFRGGMRGVLKALFELRRQTVRRLGCPLSFGFPTKPHYTAGKRILKYQDLGTMPVLFMRLNFRLAVRNRMPWISSYALSAIRSASSFGLRAYIAARGVRAASTVTTRIADSFDARIDTLWERLKGQHKILCVRDRRYLDWRYRKPGASYRIVIAEKDAELVGYAVTGVKDEPGARVGHIVDLFAQDSPDVATALVRRAVLDLLSRKADYALCWMLPDKGAFRALREAGFAQNEVAFPSVNIVFQISDPQLDQEVAGDRDNWFLTMGDSDVY